ncbi:ABC transporter permease subunit [Mesomycoplasma ovipneumoniae]
MHKLQLYNYYGKKFDTIIDIEAKTLKSYYHSAKITHSRFLDKIKIQENIEKELFLRARQTIRDNLKRELHSQKIAFKNELKVLKDAYIKLNFAVSVEKLLSFEIKKIEKELKNLRSWFKDFSKSLNQTEDSPQVKVELFEKTKKSTLESEVDLIKKHFIFQVCLNYIRKYQDFDFDLNKISQLLDEDGKKFLAQSNLKSDFFVNFYQQIKQKQEELLKKSALAKKNYTETKELQTDLYKKRKSNLELKAKQKIISLEYSYKNAIDFLKQQANQQNAAQKELISEKKQEIIAFESKNISKLNEFKHEINAQISKISAQKQKYLAFSLSQTKINFLDQAIKLFYAIQKNQNFEIPDLDISLENHSQILKDKLDFFHKLKDENQQLFDLIKSHYFGFYGSFLIKKLAKSSLKWQILLQKAKYLKQYSYKGHYLQDLGWATREKTIEDFKTRIKFINEKILAKYELKVLKSSPDFKTQQEEIKTKISEIKQNYLESVAKNKKRLQQNEIAKTAFKNLQKQAKIAKTDQKRTLFLSSKITKFKQILKTNNYRYFNELKVNKKIYESKANEALKSYPVETIKNVRFISFFLNLIFPGLAELFVFRQFIKGSLLSVVSIISYAFIIPFSFGAYWSKMGGIPGFADLGANLHSPRDGIFTDARFYLFGGVLSVILMAFVLIYFIIGAISAWRIAKAMEAGVVPGKWLYSKQWLQTTGFPWMISLIGHALMIFIVAAPIITSVLISFTDYGYNHAAPGQTVNWVGLKQWGKWWDYRQLGLFQSLASVLGWTAIWTVLSTLFPIGLGILIAILTNSSRIKGKKIFRLIFILPWAVPAFVSLSFIRSMFAADSKGYINLILINLGLIKDGISWLNQIGTARVLLIVVQTWISYAFIFMLVTGNLQAISGEIYEAGAVDGASKSQIFWKLTLPQLLLGIAPMLIGQFVGAFNNFTTISIFTGGGPAYANASPFGEASTDIIISWVFKLTTQGIKIDGHQAFAAALSTLAALISISFALRGFIKSMQRR